MKNNQPIEVKIFNSIINECEQLEKTGTFTGNGQNLAQKLSALVSEGLLTKNQKRIYDVLSKTPKTTKEISEETQMSTKLASAYLKQMQDTTKLILSQEKNKRRKLWFKASI